MCPAFSPPPLRQVSSGPHQRGRGPLGPQTWQEGASLWKASGVGELGSGPPAPAADLEWFPANEGKWAHTRMGEAGGGQLWPRPGLWWRVWVMGSDLPSLLRVHTL